MNMGLILIVVGVVLGIVFVGLRPLFVNRSDADNPAARLNRALGWIALVVVIWGVVLFVYYRFA